MPSTLWTHCIIEQLKNYHIRFLSYVPDSIIEQILKLARHDPFFDILPLAREEEGVGVCTGANLAGRRCALMMQNAGLLNSCNALTTTARQIQIPMLLLVLYAGALNDMAFPMLGEVTEPVLRALGIPSYILDDLDDAPDLIAGALVQAYNAQRPVAILMAKAVL